MKGFPIVLLIIALLTGAGCKRAIKQRHYWLAGVYGVTAAVSLVWGWRSWQRTA